MEIGRVLKLKNEVTHHIKVDDGTDLLQYPDNGVGIDLPAFPNQPNGNCGMREKQQRVSGSGILVWVRRMKRGAKTFVSTMVEAYHARSAGFNGGGDSACARRTVSRDVCTTATGGNRCNVAKGRAECEPQRCGQTDVLLRLWYGPHQGYEEGDDQPAAGGEPNRTTCAGTGFEHCEGKMKRCTRDQFFECCGVD